MRPALSPPALVTGSSLMIRRLVNYARQCICQHDWHVEEAPLFYYGRLQDILVSKTCKKCGWHQAYAKFDSNYYI